METAKASQDSTPTRSNFVAHSYVFDVPKRLRIFFEEKCILIGKQTNTLIKIRTGKDTKSRKLPGTQHVLLGKQVECQICGPTLRNIQQAKYEITTALCFAKSKKVIEFPKVQPIPIPLSCSASEQHKTRPNYSADKKVKKMVNCSSNKPTQPSNIQRKRKKKLAMKENREANPKKTRTAKLVVPLPGKIKLDKATKFPNKSARVKPLSDLEIRKFCRRNEVALKVSKDYSKWLLRKKLKSTFRKSVDNFVNCRCCLREYSTHSGLAKHLSNNGYVGRCIQQPLKIKRKIETKTIKKRSRAKKNLIADKQIFLYSCHTCSLHFTDLRTYKAHVEDRGCKFFCLDCETSFKKFADFLIHRAVTHRRQALKLNRYDCCSRIFLTFTKMRQHRHNCQSTNSFVPRYVPMPEMLDRDFVKLETNVLGVVQTENTIVIGPPGITKIDIEKQKQKNQEPPTSLTYYTNNRQPRKPSTNQKRKPPKNQKRKPPTNQKQSAPLQIMK